LSLNDKVNRIKTKYPEEGLVGVTPEGPVGHLVYIEKVESDGLIISEGNYRHGYITWRKIDKDLVIGYL